MPVRKTRDSDWGKVLPTDDMQVLDSGVPVGHTVEGRFDDVLYDVSQTLDEVHITALRMYEVEGKTYQEIADHMGYASRDSGRRKVLEARNALIRALNGRTAGLSSDAISIIEEMLEIDDVNFQFLVAQHKERKEKLEKLLRVATILNNDPNIQLR